MTKEEQYALRQFETRVRQLILEYKELETENQRLKTVIDEKEQVLAKTYAELDELKEDYARLKMAKMIDISSKELGDAKNKIAKLIREVDKCISLLNV